MNIGSGSDVVSLHTNLASAICRSREACDKPDRRTQSRAWSIDQASFDGLLAWLDPDADVAGSKYELIRNKLMRIFRNRGFGFADDLVDETFDRVARRLPEIRPYYTGNPLSYFCGVARNVCKENLRNVSFKSLPTSPGMAEEEPLLQRLDLALSKLDEEDGELILQYYQRDGKDKVLHRKKLAGELGLSVQALRERACRIRSQLRDYIKTDDQIPRILPNGRADASARRAPSLRRHSQVGVHSSSVGAQSVGGDRKQEAQVIMQSIA